MRHLHPITVQKASDKEGGDEGAVVFFQLFFTVIMLMFSAAFGK